MIKFKLHLGENKAKYWDEFLLSIDSGRRYRDISVHSKSLSVGDSVIKHFGEDLRRLKFCDLEVREIGAFTESFAQLQKLERLEFVRCVVKKECRQFEGVNGVNLPKLKTAVLEQSHWTVKFVVPVNVCLSKFILFQFLKLVDLTKLKTLKINCPVFSLSAGFVDFLSELKDLNMLALSDMNFSPFGISLEQIQQIDFPLKKLALKNLTAWFGNDANLTEFMKKVGNTLEELEVAGRYRQSNVLYEAIFKRLHKFQVLDINIRFAPNKASDDFYNSFGINSSIKTLILRTYEKTEDQEILRGFVTNLPSLETLIINGGDILNKNLHLISNNLYQLKQLNITAVCGGAFENVSIPSLTTIHLAVLWPAKKDDWKMMCRAFPNIEELSLETPYDIDYDSISVITQAWKKSLRVVFMGRGFKADTRKVELFFKNCEHIETLYVPDKSIRFESSALTDAYPKIIYANKSFVRGADDFNLWMTE